LSEPWPGGNCIQGSQGRSTGPPFRAGA
jgi:hypothetical protein